MSRDVTLLIKLNDQASGKIGKITNSTKQLERAANGAQNSIQKTNRGIRDTGKVADTASKGVNKLGRAVRGLVAGFGLFQAGKFVIFKTAELERQTKSLEVLTGSLGNARNIISELQQFGAVTPFTSTELIETAKRLKAFGFETEQVVKVTKRLADVAGATGADLGGIATAFGQIQAKGRLQGEELLQLQERGVSLQGELQKMYGLTADEFRKALEQGRIGADAVNLALQNITDVGGKYANGAIAQSETLAGKFSTLVDGIERIAVTIGNTISPVLKAVLDDTTTVINSIVTMMNQAALAEKVGLSQKEQQRLFKQAGSEAEETQRRRQGMPATGFAFGALDNEEFMRLRNERFQDLMQQEGFKRGALKAPVSAPTLTQQTPAALPALLTGTSGAAKKDVGTKQTKDEEAERLARIEKSNQDQVRALEQKTLLASALNAEEKQQFQRQTEIAEILRNEVGLNKEQLEAKLEATTNLYEQQDATKAIIEANKDRLEQEKEIKESGKEIGDLYKGIGNSIKSGVTDAIMGAIDGTKSLGEAASGILKNIGNQLISFGINSIFGGLGGGGGILGSLFGGGRASGGTVQGGRSYVVGEKGPELFTPGRTGSVAPNSSMGGNISVNVNVDASGSAVQGDGNESAQLGKAIGAAVQQELMKQKRPGGLLAGV